MERDRGRERKGESVRERKSVRARIERECVCGTLPPTKAVEVLLESPPKSVRCATPEIDTW